MAIHCFGMALIDISPVISSVLLGIDISTNIITNILKLECISWGFFGAGINIGSRMYTLVKIRLIILKYLEQNERSVIQFKEIYLGHYQFFKGLNIIIVLCLRSTKICLLNLIIIHLFMWIMYIFFH